MISCIKSPKRALVFGGSALAIVWLLVATYDMTRTVYFEASRLSKHEDTASFAKRVFFDKNRTSVAENSLDIYRRRHSSETAAYRKIDPMMYSYVLEMKSWKVRCANLSLLMYVHSAVDHRHLRDIIRTTWGSKQARLKLKTYVVFLVGMSQDKSKNIAIQKENALYGDMVQENYIDSYDNMTLKAISAMKFVNMHCPRVPFIVKTDDDIYVNVAKLYEFLNDELPKLFFNTKKVIMCNMWTDGHPFRGGKWGVSNDEYKFKNYPIFCQGAAYILTSEAVRALFDASFGEEFYKFDDVFLTGILSQKAGLSFHPINHKYKTESTAKHKRVEDVIFTLDDPLVFKTLWDNYMKSTLGRRA